MTRCNLTIIIPTYKREKLLLSLVKKIISFNIECFVINNDPEKVFTKEDFNNSKNVEILNNSENVGVIKNLFNCIKLGSNKNNFLMIHSDDDPFDINLINKSMRTFELNTSIQGVVGLTKEINEKLNDAYNYPKRKISFFKWTYNSNVYYRVLRFCLSPTWKGKANFIYGVYKSSVFKNLTSFIENFNKFDQLYFDEICSLGIVSIAKIQIIENKKRLLIENKKFYEPEIKQNLIKDGIFKFKFWINKSIIYLIALWGNELKKIFFCCFFTIIAEILSYVQVKIFRLKQTFK